MATPAAIGNPEQAAGHAGSGTSALVLAALGALGAVYGDIGTSPLYTMREAFGIPPERVVELGAQVEI